MSQPIRVCEQPGTQRRSVGAMIGAHGACQLLPALANPATLLSRAQVATEFAEVERGRPLQRAGRLESRVVLRPEAQVGGEWRRVDDLAGVQQAGGIERLLQL